MRRGSGFLALALCCLVLAACSAPGETVADWRLQTDIKNMISANELAHGCIFGPNIVDTKVASIEGDVITEHWYVKCRGERVLYVVVLRPVEGGGTHFTVTFPEQDEA